MTVLNQTSRAIRRESYLGAAAAGYQALSTSGARVCNPESSSQGGKITSRLKSHRHKLEPYKDRLKLVFILMMRISCRNQGLSRHI